VIGVGSVYRIGVDIGGTFTDLVVHDGRTDTIHQVKSVTSADGVTGVTNCLTKAAGIIGIDLAAFLGDVERVFCLGSTTGINTLLTRSGSKVGIVTTRGHGDAYHIARMRRAGGADIRSSAVDTFKPLVPRAQIAEVRERVDATGTVVIPLDEDECRAAIRRLVEDEQVDALAICFLWSHKATSHEQRAGEIARELYPDVFVSVGSELSGTLGEFSRLATAVVNAYVGRSVREQAETLSDHLRGLGLRVPILVMQTLGGVVPLSEAVRKPVTLLKSASAGGTVASVALASQLGDENVICMDMGGTSLDVSLVTYGEMHVTSDVTVAGHPLALPGVQVSSIGAGGGSIAVYEQRGSLGRLRVGPESASSRPGPACYGLGGSEPTVTDANVVLGIVSPDARLGGELPLRADLAHEAIAAKIAQPLGWDVLDAAWGIYQVITAEMADATERLLISKGFDPRQYSMMAFGAAGPAHAAAVAAILGIEKVVVPALFPVFSAVGLMLTDIRHAYNLSDDSVKVPTAFADAPLDDAAAGVQDLLGKAARVPLGLLDEEGIPEDERELRLSMDMRYAGQLLELNVEFPAGDVDGDGLRRILTEWSEKYRTVFGDGAVWSDGAIEIFNYRVVGIGRIDRPDIRWAGGGGDSPCAEPRRVYLGEWVDARVLTFERAQDAGSIGGPALFESPLGTVLVGPGDRVDADSAGNLTIAPDRDSWRSLLRRSGSRESGQRFSESIA
jgi:N-methylhydantoinase A